jgi:hypothetical protein
VASLGVLPTNLWQAYYDSSRDTTVLLDKQGKAWDIVSMVGGAFTWKSKTFETGPVSFSRARVLSTVYPVTLKLYADGDAPVAYSVPSERPITLAATRASKWAFEVTGTGRITDVGLAQSPTEFA